MKKEKVTFNKLAILSCLSIILFLGLAAPSLSFAATGHNNTTAEVQYYAYHSYFASSSTDSISGSATYSSNGEWEVYDYNATIDGLNGTYSAPETGNTYGGYSPTGSTTLANGNTETVWDYSSTQFTSGEEFYSSWYGGSATMNLFSTTRAVTPNNLTTTTTKVTVIVTIKSATKNTLPNVCTYLSDSPTQYTSSKLDSVSGNGIHGMTIVQHDDSASICVSSVKSAKLTTVWTVTKKVSGTVYWRPLVEGEVTNEQYCYAGTCYTNFQKGDSFHATSNTFTWNDKWIHNSVFTMYSPTTPIDWYYIDLFAYVTQYLYSASYPV